MPINTKLRKYLSIKQNPNLAIFQAISGLEKKAEESIDEFKSQMEATLKKEIEGIRVWLSAEIEKNVKENIFKNISQIKGEKGEIGTIGLKGDKGDSITGQTGLQGLTGVQGAKGERGLPGKDGKDSEDAIDGKSPEKGIDYFTKEEQESFMSQIVGMIKLKPLEEKIKEILKKLEQLQKVQQLGGRTLHRGGITLVWNEAVGEGDIAGTTAFDLDNTPYSTSELQVWVGGGIQFLTDDFTLSGKTITFLTAPPDGAKIRATYRKS